MAERVSVGDWPIIRELGVGGQGKVWLVRSPGRARERTNALVQIKKVLGAAAVSHEPNEELALAARLADAVPVYSREDSPEDLGAGKVYHVVGDSALEEKALKRLEVEFDVLRAIDSPNVLRLLDSDLGGRFLVTEYHPRGTLAENLDPYVGRPLEALRAFRGLVAGVAKLHERGVIHRDVKSVNVFVASDGRLVLGDFGIVFVESGRGERLTESLERVGTRDWMPPWSHTGMRVDEVKTSFDVFPLGKVLWAMLSGRAMLPFWYWQRPAYDLTKLFPNVPDMQAINGLLARTVVEHEEDCIADAGRLLSEVDSALSSMERGGQSLTSGDVRCRVCGQGTYERWHGERVIVVPTRKELEEGVFQIEFALKYGRGFEARLLSCDSCGHVQIFRYDPKAPPPAWRGRSAGHPSGL